MERSRDDPLRHVSIGNRPVERSVERVIRVQFTKMHGAGNDYVYVDCFREKPPENLEETARQISDRHFGVGGDGLVLIHPSDRGDARMQMFNADGSEAEMCGNAIRCVGKYLFEKPSSFSNS